MTADASLLGVKMGDPVDVCNEETVGAYPTADDEVDLVHGDAGVVQDIVRVRDSDLWVHPIAWVGERDDDPGA